MKKFLLALLLTSVAVFGADKKISQLPSLTQSSWSTADQIPIVHSGSTDQTTIGDFDARYVVQSVLAYAGVSHQWINTISAGGVASSTRPACADLSDSVSSCSVNTTNASNISSGLLGLARGGTNADLSATGGASQVLKQTSVGGAVSVARLACADLSNAAASCSTDTTVATNITSGTLPAAQLPNPSASTLGGVRSIAAVTNNFLTAISTSGVPSQARPACADLSNAAASCSTDTTSASNISSGLLGVAQGGTNKGSFTAYSVVTAGTTSTGTFQNVSGVGTSGQVLTSNGASALPTWQAASSGGANPLWNYTSQTTTYSALINDYVQASGASFTITLPDPTAVGNTGKTVAVRHAGTSLSQKYTLHTPGATIDGVADNAFILTTAKERLILISDGSSTWRVLEHDTDTDWITDTTATMQFATFTVTSASSTIAATYVPAYQFSVTSASATAAATYTPTEVFTITAGNTASVNAVYSSGGNNCTLVKALLVGDTTAVFTCAIAPASSGSLVYVSGTHTGGNITFASVAGGINAPTLTVASTIASATTLYLSGVAGSIPGSGQLAKTGGTGDAIIVYSSLAGESTTNKLCTTAKTIASLTTLITQCTTAIPVAGSGWLAKTGGTGDNVITYSALSGAAATIGDSGGTPPVLFGSPTNNSVQWRRHARQMTLWFIYYQATAGASAGAAGDYTYPLPTGVLFDTTVLPVFNTGSGIIGETPSSMVSLSPFITGAASYSGNAYYTTTGFAPFTSSSYRVYGNYNTINESYPLGSTYLPNVIMSYNWQITFDVSDWQP